MNVLHLNIPADGDVVRSVARLQRLRFLLEQAPPPGQRISLPSVARSVELPSFAEMMAIVEQRGQHQRYAGNAIYGRKALRMFPCTEKPV